MRMLNGSVSPYIYCKDLQTLVTVTLENVIIPLRDELNHCDEDSEILALEVQDAENKIYECLAQQISVICNADEEIANHILREYPRSETCFKCLGINEDTAQGLLRIRGIGFLQLLDMPDEDVTNILQNYGDSIDEIEHVISGLAKIRSNIDLIESDLAFDDDTRNLIKLVVRLNKEHIEEDLTAYFDDPLLDYSISNIFDSETIASQPSRMPTDPLDQTTKVIPTEKLFTADNSQKAPMLSPFGNLTSLTPVNQQLPASPGCITPICSPATINVSTAPSQTADSVIPNGFSTTEISSSRSANYFWDGDVPLGGVSVPATPLWLEKKPCSVTVSPPHGIQSTWNGFTSEIPSSFSTCDRALNQNQSSYYIRDRERSRQPGTPPPKHRLKLLFPLHRSKSHESNLSNRVTPPTTCSVSVIAQEASKPLACSNALSPDALSSNGEAFLYHDVNTSSPSATCFRVVSTAQLSPTPNIRGCSHEHYPCTPIEVQSVNRTVLSSPNSRSYDSVRRVSCDYRSPKRPLQPPTLMTTSVDGENLMGVLNIPRSGGTTLVVSSNGLMHKFELDSKFGDFVRGTPCAICNNRMSFRFQHCLGCRIKVHKSCMPHSHRLPCANPTIDGSEARGSPVAGRKSQVNVLLANQTGLRPAHSTPAFQGSESNSASSCTSSAPGSPFGMGASFPNCHSSSCGATHPGPIASPCTNHAAIVSGVSVGHLSSPVSAHTCGSAGSVPQNTGQPLSPHHPWCCNQFEFPMSNTRDNLPQDIIASTDVEENHPLISTHSSAESEKTVIDGAVRRLESMDSQDEYSNLVRANSISVTLKEWDIPMDSLVIGDIIGQGTFGTVYRAKWHGEVAVKRIDIDPEDVDGSARLDAFKKEVALLHKTRHENLVLFMGACMKPPDLAIVTQLSQGETLYHQLHYRDTVMAVNRTINIACQIAKGMGYLHARGIVHRDLKTRNIFVEANARVVIGDFGVFNFVRLCKKAKWGNYLNVPPSWLCYIAPEIIRALNLNNGFVTTASELPLTPSSDVFAFGTVWYELLTNEFPFKGLPAEAVIYLSGRGIKQNLRIPGPKDFKEILTQCWAYSPARRPEFTTVVRLLDRLPKLHRSPSYPAKPTSCINSVSHDGLV